MDLYKPGAMRRHPTFVRLNKFAMTVCVHGACLGDEYNMRGSKWVALVDRLTLVFSFVVMATCTYKFCTHGDGATQAAIELAHSDEWQWHELLSLDYLPRINQFGILYYGLMLMTVGIPFAWRVYMGFIRRPPAAAHTSQAGLSLTIQLVDDQVPRYLHKYANAFLAPKGTNFDSRRELIDFFIAEPPVYLSDPRRQLSDEDNRQVAALIAAATLRRNCSQSDVAPLLELERRARRDLLSRVHENRCETAGSELFPYGSSLDSDEADEQPGRASWAASARGRDCCLLHWPAARTYTVPIRSADFLVDKTERRWLHLALHFNLICLIIFLAWLPLFSLAIVGLSRVNSRFGPVLGRWPPSGRANFDLLMRVYGRLEQFYASIQVAVSFVFANIILYVLHADLIYKAEPILRELKQLRNSYALAQLRNSYALAQLRTVSIEAVRLYQLRVWAFFDQIRVIDSFISCYSVLALIMLVAGFSFAQSFARVEEMVLKMGTAAALFSDFLSFTILHLISDHTERMSRPIARDIFSILARESNPYARLEWQRILREFYRHGYVRTFTVNGKYPMNMFTYLKTLTALLAACTLTNRLFHRNKWDSSFLQQASPRAAAAPTS